MVDTFKRSSFWVARFGGANASGIAVVKRAQQEPLKINFIDALRLAAHGDGLTDEGFADGTHPALPFDLTVVPDMAHDPTARIAEWLRSAITSPTAVIEIGRVTSTQRFMRTHGIVIRPPAITASLLAGRMSRCRPGGVAFEFTMHLFMRAVLLGMTGIFTYNVFFFMGLKTVTASRASLIVATNPVFISLFSVLLFKERMNAGKVMGIILCLAGAAIVISHGNLPEIFQGKLGWGEVYILGCVASWVAYSLIGKVIMKDLSPLHAVTYSCLIGTLALFFPAWQEGIYEQIMTYTAIDWTGIFYLGFFGTVLGFLWYYEGIQVIGPSRAAVFINFVPVSGFLLGWLLLDESINLSLLTGAALVIGGVYLTNKIKNT